MTKHEVRYITDRWLIHSALCVIEQWRWVTTNCERPDPTPEEWDAMIAAAPDPDGRTHSEVMTEVWRKRSERGMMIGHSTVQSSSNPGI